MVCLSVFSFQAVEQLKPANKVFQRVKFFIYVCSRSFVWSVNENNKK